MKKIAIFSSEFYPLRGGIGTYASEMARAAHNLGAEVTVFAPNYNDNHSITDKQNFPYRVIRYSGGRHSSRYLLNKIIFTFRVLLRNKYDVVLAADWPFYLPIKIGLTSAKKKYMIHGSEIIELCSPIKRTIVKLINLFGQNGIFYTNSEYTKNLLFSKFGNLIKAKVKVELLGTSEFWFERDNSFNYRERYSIPEDKFLILTVARLTPRKGHSTVIEAINRLPVNLKEKIHYGIVGPAYDPDYFSELKKMIADFDISVSFMGELSDIDLRGLYGQSDLFCLLGKDIKNGPVEGYGLVYLEAAAQGIPAIAGNIGGMPEAVINGVSGFVVDINDLDSVSAAICNMLNFKQQRLEFGVNARKRAIYLSWSRCAAATFDLS